MSNEQRANILRTYPVLVASAADPTQQANLAVLLTQAAVSAMDSGYMGQAEDKGLDSTAMAALELIRKP